MLDREVDPACRVDRGTAGHRGRPAIHTIRHAIGVAALWVSMCGSYEVIGFSAPHADNPVDYALLTQRTLRPFVEATGGLAIASLVR